MYGVMQDDVRHVTVRPEWAGLVLQDFDAIVRETFESTLGSAIDDESWQQAQLSLAAGGFGLRCGNAHAPAASLAISGQLYLQP